MTMFKSLFGLASDIAKVADAVVSVPVALVRPLTKMTADAAAYVKETVEELTNSDEGKP